MSDWSSRDLENEIWKGVPGFSIYEVSSIGRVRRVGGKPRRLTSDNGGYQNVTITDGPRRCQVSVHALVATAFHGPKPSAAHECAHWDGNPANNRVWNLRWATKTENAADRDRHGKTARGDSNGKTKLSDANIALIFADRAMGLTQYALADKYNISQAQVWNILNRRQRLRPHAKSGARP